MAQCTWSIGCHTYTSTYTYDKNNRLTKATEGAISANYTYDSFSRMTGLTAKNGVPLTTKMPHI